MQIFIADIMCNGVRKRMECFRHCFVSMFWNVEYFRWGSYERYVVWINLVIFKIFNLLLIVFLLYMSKKMWINNINCEKWGNNRYDLSYFNANNDD